MNRAKPKEKSHWTFLTNHAHILLCLTKNPNLRTKDLAELVGITERAVQRIIAELTEDGCIDRKRVGRSNTYTIHTEHHLKHPIEAHRTIADLIALLLEYDEEQKGS